MHKYPFCACMMLSMVLTLLRVPKNNHVKGFLGSILTPTCALGSFMTPGDAWVKYEGIGSTD